MDKPRRRANKKVGHGSWKRDRPPVLGIFGRQSRTLVLKVLRSCCWDQLRKPVLRYTQAGTCVYSDDWNGYNRLNQCDREHQTCCHDPMHRVWAEDKDGDGIRETHCNTLEGLWTGLRNYLRTFRGVNKEYLQQYVATFQWAFCLAKDLPRFLRLMLPVATTGGI